MVTWFEQNAVTLIGHALTIVTLVAGAIILFWRLNRQHRNTLQLQRDNAREELKLRLYEILVQRVRKLSHANTTAATYALLIPSNLEAYQRQFRPGFTPVPPKERAPEFAKLNTEANNALIELLEEFEAWSIAFPGFQIFQIALNSAIHDVREAFHPLFLELLNCLPTDPPEGAPDNIPRPIIKGSLSKEEIVKLRELVDRYYSAMCDIIGYVFDLTIEAQNNLLSGLFDRRVPPRKPIDPTLKVISTEPEQVAKLRLFFENETAWGKEKAIAERNAVASKSGAKSP